MANAVVHYERSSPSLLAKQTDTPSEPRPLTPWPILAMHLEQRLSALRMWRLSWWSHWSALAEFILPRRYHWFVTANTMNRGSQINQKIVDPTGTQAMRVCASGMMSGQTSPSRPWFNIRPRDRALALDFEARVWIDEVEARLYEIMAKSNFYDSMAQLDEDLAVFGTAPMIIYEDEQDGIRCYNPCVGEYFLGAGATFRVETLYREFTLTILQIVDMFGIENCPADIQSLWSSVGANLETERVIAHAIEPNFPVKGFDVIKPSFPYREAYWLKGNIGQAPLSLRGYNSKPFFAVRWGVTSNDAYGRSPGMDVLPDIMQLQVMTKRKAEAIEKQVRPPLLADAQLKNEPSSILPGHVTYVQTLGGNGSGMRPIYEVKPDLQYMTADIAAIQTRIQRGFFNDLFLMLAETDPSKRMTATEVAERQGEKLQVLGPVIERFQNEALSPAILRILDIMQRKAMLPPLPDSLKGVPMQFEYVSMLALAQKAAQAAGMERLAATTAGFVAVAQEVMDNIDSDAFVQEYGEMLLVPHKILRSADQIQAIRKDRAAKQAATAQQQQALQLGSAAVDGAKVLSDTNVGGGQNALAMMLGIGGVS